MDDEIQNVRVEDWPISQEMSTNVSRRIVGIVLGGYEAHRMFWMPAAERARLVIAYLKANYFDEQALAEMDAEGKIPIEIAEGWPKLLAEIGMAKNAMKVGKPTAQAPENALDAEGASILLNAIRDHENIESKKIEAYTNNLITGFPQFVWCERPANPSSNSIIDFDQDPWDCTLPDANSRKPDFSDLEIVYRIRYPSKDDLLWMFSDREKEIEEAFGSNQFKQDQLVDFGITIDERDLIYSAIQAANSSALKTGRIHLIQRHSLIKKTMDLWTAPDTEKFEYVEPAKEQEWLAAHPGGQKVRATGKVHWVTSVLATGQLLENRPHWFQDQRFNCEVLNLMMIDGKPISVLGFAAANWYLAAVAKTEHIHQLRLDSGNPVVIQEGSLENADNIEYEISRPRGKIIVKRGKDVRSAITKLDANRTNPAWNQLYQETRETNDRMTVDQNTEGGSQSSQESGKVVGIRVAQTATKFSRIYDNANAFYLRTDNLILRCAQKLIGKQHITMSWLDPRLQEEKNVEVNIPDMNDPNVFLGGDPTKWTNQFDLTEYKVVMAEQDNSLTGRQAELAEFLSIMETLSSRVPPEALGEMLISMPNTICQRVGKKMAAQAEAAAKQKPEPAEKVNVIFPMDKLGFNPSMQAAASQMLGLQLPPASQQPAGLPPQAPPQQQEQPPMQGDGVSAPVPQENISNG
jgi:hypothetical protein